MEENKKNYCVAVIFKNGMKITSQLTTKRKAKQKIKGFICWRKKSNVR